MLGRSKIWILCLEDARSDDVNARLDACSALLARSHAWIFSRLDLWVFSQFDACLGVLLDATELSDARLHSTCLMFDHLDNWMFVGLL